jgi:hypothetical protein
MSSYWVMGVMAAAHAKPQSSGVPYLTIFGVVGTAFGLLGVFQQFTSSIRNRKYSRAQQKLLRVVDSSEVINESLSKVEQYKKEEESLRTQVEVQVPKQARIVYLTNRLEQVTNDLLRSYRQYEDVRKELDENAETTELNQNIRDVISALLPQRSMQESRYLYMLSLVILLLVFNISPIGPSDYFHIVENSLNSDPGTLAAVMLSGALCLIPVWLLCLSFVSNGNPVWMWFQKLNRIPRLALSACPMLVSAAAVALGFILWDRASYDYYIQGLSVTTAVNYVEALFNISVIAFSIGVAVPASVRQRRIWQAPGTRG